MDTPCSQYYGIDLDGDGDVIVAEDIDGSPRITARYRADATGMSALRRHIGAGQSRRRICVRCTGASALDFGLQLIPICSAEVMFVAPHALQPRGVRTAPPLATAEQRAQRLAVMARRML